LIASCLLAGCMLWTTDKALAAAAGSLALRG
jgi:hypothetical protein